MQVTGVEGIIESAVATVREASAQQTGGKWLENITVLTAPLISEWDVESCYPWTEWPDREFHFPNTTNQDVGIDAVAVRRSDGEHIAIQCKSRQLDEHGHGASINKGELDKFISSSAGDFWAERWLITNGDTPIGPTALQTPSLHDKPIKMVNIANDLLQQQAAFTGEECPHCEPNPDGEERRQTKTCMQNEAVAESVRILQEHKQSDSGGLLVGQARGSIILPCGTGKTRISLRIVEELTPPGQLSIVLCPSIALVAQIRREYLQHAATPLRALAVCSDETAGYDPKKESSRNTAADPTLDNSNVSASEVKGKVTTRPGGNRSPDTRRAERRPNQRHLRHLPERPPRRRGAQGDRRDCQRTRRRRGPPHRRTAPEAQRQERNAVAGRAAHPRFHPVPRQRHLARNLSCLPDGHAPYLRHQPG